MARTYGSSPARACQADQRFSYFAHVPERAYDRVAVLVHGSDRDPKAMRDGFIDWANEHDCAIIAPLFPGGIIDADDMDAYKGVLFHGLRFDEVLLSMVDEVSARYALQADKLLMFGFSGGAQFLHRFVLLHPERVRAASIAAPGNVTLLDGNRGWWVGTRNVPALFGRNLDLAALRQVRLQTIIGSLDDGREVIRVHPHEARWVEGANDAGDSRPERLRALEENWRAHGLHVSSRVVEGVAHDMRPMLPPVTEFFSEVLSVP